jgi:hypothetical protein
VALHVDQFPFQTLSVGEKCAYLLRIDVLHMDGFQYPTELGRNPSARPSLVLRCTICQRMSADASVQERRFSERSNAGGGRLAR